MIKFILKFSIFLFSLNSFAYEINAILPSGFDFKTVCDMEKNDLKSYENFVEAHQILSERLGNLESGTEKYSEAETSLKKLDRSMRTMMGNMIEFNIGSTLVGTTNVTLSRDYNLDSSLFFEQIDDLRMLKMVISPSVFDEKANMFKVSGGVVLVVELSSFAVCPYNQNLEQAIRSYLDTVFSESPD